MGKRDTFVELKLSFRSFFRSTNIQINILKLYDWMALLSKEARPLFVTCVSHKFSISSSVMCSDIISKPSSPN